MPSAETAARGRALLRSRVAEAPAVLEQIPPLQSALLDPALPLPRAILTTGIGTSEGHARHLAELAARGFGWPARFAATGALEAGPPPGSERDWLVVFSQGLSPNARVAFRHLEAWGAVLLVTGLSLETSEAEGLTADKRAWLSALEAAGVIRIDLGCGAEYGSLLRVIGARAGYVVAWSLLRTLAHRRLEPTAVLAIDPRQLARAQHEATSEASRAFDPARPIAPFFAPDRSLLVVGQGGVLEWVDQLALKLAEGLLRPRPWAVDVLAFAHGPLQAIAERPATILYLAETEEHPEAARWRERLAATLDPGHHALCALRTRLPWPFAAVEFEAIFDELVLRVLAETDYDLVDWPGATREGALYAAGPASDVLGAKTSRPDDRRDYEERVWPEIESAVRAGRDTAIVGLGSIEQHGPHLPLGTDRWIADALAQALAARRAEALALPALALGCASEHLDFAGTLHVSPETLEAVLGDLLESLRRHGFERAFVFTAHGGNVDALRSMDARLTRRVRPLVLRIETALRVGAMQAEAVARESLDALSAGPHAGEYETSLIAWLRPGSVRPDPAPGRRVEPGEAQGLFYPSLRPHAKSGVLGDPSSASAGRGARYLAAWVDLLEQAYAEAFGGGSKKRQ